MSDYTTDQLNALGALDAWVAGTSSTESSFFCLQGYAGVGKTWLVGDWLERLLAANPEMNIVVVAPTNKAVDVLRSKCAGRVVNGESLVTLVTFRTLDSYLGFRVRRDDDWQMQRSRNEKKSDGGPDLVVCDESSMVKEEYHQELRLRRVPVLYVGDPAQLQPVGEAQSLAFAVPDKVLMTQIVRQSEGNPIIALATHLRKLIEQGSNEFILHDLRQYATPGDRRIAFTGKQNVYTWAEAAIDKGLDCRILAFTNAAVGVHNATMHARRYPDAPLFGEGELALVNEAFEYDDGGPDPVLMTNGELLRVLSCEKAEPVAGVDVYTVRAVRLANSLEVDGETVEGELKLSVARDPEQALRVHRALTGQIYDKIAEVQSLQRSGQSARQAQAELDTLYNTRRPLNKLAPIRHAYACTVHKSQGSTYDVAFVDFGDVYRSREMRARLMYVAVTRPSKFLVLLHNGG